MVKVDLYSHMQPNQTTPPIFKLRTLQKVQLIRSISLTTFSLKPNHTCLLNSKQHTVQGNKMSPYSNSNYFSSTVSTVQ